MMYAILSAIIWLMVFGFGTAVTSNQPASWERTLLNAAVSTMLLIMVWGGAFLFTGIMMLFGV